MRNADRAGTAGSGASGDFGALAQQYWNAWSEAMRSAASGAGATVPPSGEAAWQAALDSWSQLTGGGRSETHDVLERFSTQARQWFGKMQEVAGQFTGRAASAEDITRVWKQAMGMEAENPFANMFAQMSGRGQSGLDQWFEQVGPFLKNSVFGNGGFNNPLSGMGTHALSGMHHEAQSWLQIPAFGQHREQQERLQALMRAQLELQQANDAYNALMMEASRNSFDRFERKLAERSEPGRQLQSARALFDLWIDAAEEAYAEIALSPDFRRCYAELVNAQMRVRAGVQREVEQMGALFGMPTRTEVDSAHRKIAELERQLRRMRDSDQRAQTEAVRRAPTPVSSAATGKTAKASAAVMPAAKKSVAATSVVKKPLVRTKSAQRSIAKKPTAKKPAKSATTSRKSALVSPTKRSATRAVATSAVKRGARPSLSIAIPVAPKPIRTTQAKAGAKLKAVKPKTAPKAANRKR